jgi:hypothetical protein
MASLSDEEIYERTVNELPFAEDELEVKTRYWSKRSVKERMQGAHELMRRHYAREGTDIETLRMDKAAVRISPHWNGADSGVSREA